MKSKTSFFNRTVFKKNMTLYWPIWVCYLLYGMVKVPGQLWSRLQQQTDMTAYARDYAEKHNIKIEGLERPVNDISEKEEAPEEEY